jgi:hypothetical protein
MSETAAAVSALELFILMGFLHNFTYHGRGASVFKADETLNVP